MGNSILKRELGLYVVSQWIVWKWKVKWRNNQLSGIDIVFLIVIISLVILVLFFKKLIDISAKC